jgi:hypothetical protein
MYYSADNYNFGGKLKTIRVGNKSIKLLVLPAGNNFVEFSTL